MSHFKTFNVQLSTPEGLEGLLLVADLNWWLRCGGLTSRYGHKGHEDHKAKDAQQTNPHILNASTDEVFWPFYIIAQHKRLQ